MSALKRWFWVALAWFGVPGDVHWWWTVAFPLSGASTIDAFLVFVREAPLGQVVLAFIVAYVVFAAVGVLLRRWIARQDQGQLAEERRRRIEEWRSVIRDFDFDTNRFASTDTYSQMRPHLQSEVVEMLEAPRTLHIGNEARGETPYRYRLLDEVERIERKWGLI